MQATAFSGSSVTAWATREERSYNATGQVASVTNGAGNVTLNAYDGLDRLFEVTDPVGRVTRFDYDLAGQQLRESRAYGTPLQQDYATYTYSPNGQRLSVTDANANRSSYVYDGFDRLSELHFPVTALGAATASASDYEAYGYDANSNRTSLRLRSGETIAFGYDALNRETLRDLPGAAANDVYSAYDLAGRRLSARFGSAGGQGVVYAYDIAGRLASETATIGPSRALITNTTRRQTVHGSLGWTLSTPSTITTRSIASAPSARTAPPRARASWRHMPTIRCRGVPPSPEAMGQSAPMPMIPPRASPA